MIIEGDNITREEIINIRIEEDLDFEIQQLNFSRYEVEDGTILRILNIPTKIFRLADYDKQGFPEYLVQHKNIVSALVPQELRGEASHEIFNLKKDRVDIIEFIPLEEPFNEFKLGDGTLLRIRLIVNQVFKSEKRNYLGEPIYVIDSLISITRKIPDHLRKNNS
ncbi:MAG: hypothetical protein K9W45_03375 [Candidatus Heimdallarchaeum aukensis]|uniref:Uncharacterized protein n=1 Tax=Candidatus Heimdallarchaeum aukensis TaxID=2876573 RepID=A0A9Y1BMB8_9ARCH|nr:MAG: hypothetical protein K9W45_03375 [Candidatus Heimdallarchaeum aukensis]